MKAREDLVGAVVQYFHSTPWQRVVKTLQEPEVMHAHIYIYTSINPHSLEQIWKGWSKKVGWEHYRERNDHYASSGEWSAFTINPRGMPHFSIYWRYNPDLALAPGIGPEGRDFDYWRKKDVDEFINKYEKIGFRPVGPKEVTEIEKYFMESEQWKRVFTLLQDPKIAHFHMNVETSIHPLELEKFARAELEARGIHVNRAVHMIFHAPYKAKIVFMTEGNVTWDIGWTYNPLTTLKPSCSPVVEPEDPQFDIWTLDMYDKLIGKYKFTTLDEDEVKKVIDAI
jgi:hypothetical protein